MKRNYYIRDNTGYSGCVEREYDHCCGKSAYDTDTDAS